MKRTKIAFLLVLLMSMAGIRAFAYDIKVEGIYFNKIKNNTELQVTKPGSDDPKYSGVVNVPEIANGLPVTSIDTQAFAFSNLTSVNIPKSVTEIGYEAFSYCNNLSTITVDSDNPVYYSPEGSNAIIVKNSKGLVVGCQATDIPVGVKSIGNYAFYGCSSLNSITIPGSVLDIYPYAFYGCKNLTSVTIQNGVENQYIMSYAFAGCENLASVTIPSTVRDIDEGAFNRCNKLTKVYISDLEAWCKINYVCTPDHPHPFSWNHGLYLNDELITDLVIPDGVTSIKEGAFYGCTNQFSVTIPSAVTSIGKGAFNGCNGLQSVTVKIDEPLTIDESTFSKRIGVTLNVPIGCGEAYRNADYWGDFTIVEMLPAIISYADANVKAKCVENWDTNGDGEIDESEAAAVNELSDVFYNLPITSFDELQYFTGLTSIDGSAFRNCSSLTSITIPDNVTTIGWGAFNGCTGLTSITIPDNVTTIGGNAFYNCTGLTSVTINSNSITEIAGSPFYGCTGLTSFDIPSSVTSIGTRAFQECSSLTSITIPSSVTSIASDAFQGCTGLTSMIVESGNTIFDSRDDCNAIIKTASNTLIAGCKTTVIPNSVTAIGNLAFFDCSGLESITIPSSVTSIAISSFSGCTGLTSMIVESGNATYDSRDNCNAIIETASNKLIAGCKTTVVPNSVTAIGDGAFQYCSTLTSVVIPYGVTSIGNGAFYNCSGLESVTIPRSVTTFGESVFTNSSSLTSVYVEWDYPISIRSSVFSNSNYKNATLYVPTHSADYYRAENYWKDFKEIVEKVIEVTDISQMDNAIYIEPFSAVAGGDVNIEICMKNANAATAYVFDLVLPNGVTVAKNSSGKYIDALSERHDDHTRTFNYKGDNTYSLSTLSGNSEELKGYDGAIRLLTLHVEDNVEDGVYAIQIKGASYSKPDGSLVAMPNTTSTVTVEDYVLGDVNGNGGVDIGDAVSIVNYLVGKASSTFVEKAADTNKNGQIDIGDAVTIVNLLVGKVESLSRMFYDETSEKEPQ